MFGAKMEIINITKKEISGFPEIYSYLSERITQYPSSGAKYIGGHPNIADSFIDCFIIIQDDGIVIERIPEYSELFKLPWEKIDSITTDIKSDWKGTNLAAGWLLLGPIGSMLMGKSTQEQLGVVVKGKDGNGDPVKVPIAFDSVKNIVKIKAASDRYMIRTAGISI
jgi:hypothetical protein